VLATLEKGDTLASFKLDRIGHSLPHRHLRAVDDIWTRITAGGEKRPALRREVQ
jgi:hypothetical protein